MHPIAKEHLLHKILAGSAFGLALSLLPIAHFLQTRPTEAGTVAGVSTDTSITSQSCVADRQQKLDDLDRWLKNQQAYDLNEYTAANQNAQANSGQSQALYDTYIQKLARESSVVTSQKEEVASSACPLP